MAGSYLCQHDGQRHDTYTDMSLERCGHDGTVHMACEPRPAPAGTPRPEGWPEYLSWPYPTAFYLENRAETIEELRELGRLLGYKVD